MRTQSIDTTPEFERVQVARIRSFPPSKKFASVRSWTHAITSANLRTGDEHREREDAVQFVNREYGGTWAGAFAQELEQRPNWALAAHDIQTVLLAVLETFEHSDISYALTGSIACSVYGFPRSAQDVDLLASISPSQLPELAKCWKQASLLYLPELARELAQPTGLSLLHLLSLVKVDILPPASLFEQAIMQRRQPLPLIKERGPVWVLSPEDVALTRLVWYCHTGATADDQWNDLLGLFKVQAPSLDLVYLWDQVQSLHVADLLEHVLIDAGICEA